MDTITLKIKNKSKFKHFLALIKDLDYVEVIKKGSGIGKEKRVTSKDDFFELAGMWKDREISAKDLRAKAWPDRK